MITHQHAIQIADKLLLKNFPELNSKRIRYYFVAGKRYDYYMAVRWVFFECRVYIEKEILQFSQEAFTGCLAHEFAHIVLSGKRNFFSNLFDFRSEIKEERAADLLVMEKGLGKELLRFHQEHGKSYKAYKSSEGLTKKEIKSFLKKEGNN